MGVTNLWTILAPVKKHKKLHELKGQTIAVDLSIWVCENQSVKQMHGVIVKPHLRNLFFRVSYLTQLGAKLVFVIEGEAPELKWEEMWKRQQARGLVKPGTSFKHCKRKRSQFTACLRECCQLLDILGIPHVTGKGEAEAMCAALNAAGLVDACITDDGDAFLYGARTVYRNFTMNSKDPHVESFNMGDIESDLGIGRRHLVALSLLLGCDYLPGGVTGVGVANAVKLLKSLEDVDVIGRLSEWRRITSSQCVNKVEMSIREKAIKQPDFPQQQVIDEFLVMKEKLPKREFHWKKANISSAQTFAASKLDWPIDYTLEKVLPLITLWSMWDLKKNGQSRFHIQPHRIVKTRVRHGVPCYEVEWIKDVYDTTSTCDYYTTIEEQSLFTDCFPHHVDDFNTKQADKKTKKRVPKKVKKDRGAVEVENITSQIDSLNLNPTTTSENLNKEPIKTKREKTASMLTQVDEFTSSVCNSLGLGPSGDMNSQDEVSSVSNKEEEEVFVPLSVRLKIRQTRSISKLSSAICNSQSEVLSVLPHHPTARSKINKIQEPSTEKDFRSKDTMSKINQNQEPLTEKDVRLKDYISKINDNQEPLTEKDIRSQDSNLNVSSDELTKTPESTTPRNLSSVIFLDKDPTKASNLSVLNHSQSRPNKLSLSKTRLSTKDSLSENKDLLESTPSSQHGDSSRICHSDLNGICVTKESVEDINLCSPTEENLDSTNDLSKSVQVLDLADNQPLDEITDNSSLITDECKSVSSCDQGKDNTNYNHSTEKYLQGSPLKVSTYSDSLTVEPDVSVIQSPLNTTTDKKDCSISDRSNTKETLPTKLIYSATKPSKSEVLTSQLSSFHKTPSSVDQTRDLTFGNFDIQASLLNSLLQTSGLESPKIPELTDTVNDVHQTEFILNINQTPRIENDIHCDTTSNDSSVKCNISYLRMETFERNEALDSPYRGNSFLEVSMPVAFSPMTPQFLGHIKENVKASLNYKQVYDNVFQSPMTRTQSSSYTESSPKLLYCHKQEIHKNLDYGDSNFQNPYNLKSISSPRQPLSLKDRLKLRLKSQSTQSALQDLSS